MDKFSAVLLLLCFPGFLNDVAGEVVHITVLTVQYTNVGASNRVQYQCYRSDPDGDALLSFDRSAPVTTDRAPPADVPHSNNYPNVRVVKFPYTSPWTSEGFGPFYCEASKPGRDVTRVTTFFQRYDAKFIPSDGMFTKTVNVNDTNVMISMTIQTQSSNEINWRKDGGGKLDTYNGQNQISLPNPIQTSDAGIYEIHYDTERTDNRGGLYRLIVRECPAGKWGPPECYGICDKCYNGGVCDDKSGLCICPNNFKGPNCLEICRPGGGNRFGWDCEFRCSYHYNRLDQCHGALFCLPDPYGCSCDVGAHGHACNTLCSPGTYGPSCSQTCHCAAGSSCDIYTGGCTLGCQAGWSGDNCQIPDVCEAGYYGAQCVDKCHCLNDAPCDKQTGECPQRQCARGYKLRSGQVKCQECEGSTFGEDCLQQCHCSAEACETERGLCKGQCIDKWIEPDCQTRISRLISEKVNPHQPSSFTCYVEGNPVPSETLVNLYRYNGSTYSNATITRRSSSVSGSELAVFFDVDSVYPEDYVCSIAVGNGGSLTITNTTHVLPVIAVAPVILSTTSTTVRLQWNAWSEGDDIGDPPLVGYDVLVKKGSDWITDQRADHPTTSATVANLNPDTEYRFRVAAVREGPGGTGEPSPRNSTATLCGKPSDSPSGLEITAINPKELQVNWELLSPESAACRSGVTSYTIYYTPTGSTSPNSVIVSNDTSSYNLTGLGIYLDYTIQMTASNKDEESDTSSEIIHTTLEEVAPAPINVVIPRSTTSSFTLSWSTPLPSNINGNIQKFIIRYQQTAPIADDDHKMEEVSLDVFEGEHTVMDLPAQTNYTVQVRTVNGAGYSNWSIPVNAKTINTGGTSSPLVGHVVGGVVATLIIIILAIILVLVIFRRRRDNKSNDSRALRKNSGNGVSAVIYENEEIGNHDNTYDGVAYEKPAAEESAYEGVDIRVPPSTVPPTKPPIQPRVQAQNTNGKPVAVVLPERLENKPKPPPQPKPYALYAKEKSGSNASLDGITKEKKPGKKSKTPPVAPRDRSRSQDNLAPSVGLRDQSGSQDNLEERGVEEMDGGDIYQNVTFPGVVLVSELEEYIKSKKKGNTNELVHEFNLLNINQQHPWEVASKEKNKAKNRFKNIIAYDHSRVVLEKVDGDPHSDYYNANYINDYNGEKAFIASQAPNTASLTAFWRMVWQENVSTIVMVTNLIEAGKDRCRQYWPKNPRSVEVMGDFSLFLLETEQFSDHVVRTLRVKKAGDDDDDEDEEKRTIKQFHYLSWPDMGVPEYSTTLITFTEAVKQHHTRLQSTGHTGPMLVHCSAGVGRTGTFICLYNMLDKMRKEGKVDIFGFITKMRNNRIKMVQTKEQYVFLYNALLEVCLSGNTAIPVSKFKEKLDTLNRANSVTKKANIQVEFENLHTLTPTPTASSFRGGRSPSNRKKNRFPDILPMERSRPYLASAGLADSTDYINASFLNTFLKKDVFLATQSPLPNTVVDLWRLVFDWKCPVIVMLNEVDGETCVQYWPEEGSMLLGSLEITALDSESTMNFVKRRFSVTSDSGESVTVEQFEMLGWGMSHNKPDSPLSLLCLIEAVESSVKAAESKGPAIVHCINGIGRSGVFCALWSVMEKVRRENTVDIFQAVKRLRSNRPNMVETLDQYHLCYDVMNQHLHQFEEYANLDIL